MQPMQSKKSVLSLPINPRSGFTMVELMVAMVIGAIVMGVIFATHNVQQRTYRQESLKLATIQNGRAALAYMEREIRLAGFDRPNSGLFGLTDIRLDGSQNGIIAFTYDMGTGGNADNGRLDADETVTYALYNSTRTLGALNTDLGRTPPFAPEPDLVAEGIEAIGLAYAFDSDNDGRIDWNDDGDDIKQPSEGEFWAIDVTGDLALETNLDTNFDGNIDGNDAVNGSALPTLPSGNTTVPIDRIRAVKVMLLARSKAPDLNHSDSKNYRVGVRVVPSSDNYHRRLLITTIRCRNLGL